MKYIRFIIKFTSFILGTVIDLLCISILYIRLPIYKKIVKYDGVKYSFFLDEYSIKYNRKDKSITISHSEENLMILSFVLSLAVKVVLLIGVITLMFI